MPKGQFLPVKILPFSSLPSRHLLASRLPS